MSALCLAKDLVTVQSPISSFPWKSYQIKSRGYALTRSTLLRFFALTTIVGSILILKSYSLVFSIPIASWFPYSRRRISVWRISLRTRYFSISNLFTLQAHQSCITSVFVNNAIVTNQWVYRRDQFIFAVRTSFLWPSQPSLPHTCALVGPRATQRSYVVRDPTGQTILHLCPCVYLVGPRATWQRQKLLPIWILLAKRSTRIVR